MSLASGRGTSVATPKARPPAAPRWASSTRSRQCLRLGGRRVVELRPRYDEGFQEADVQLEDLHVLQGEADK
eukprot:6603162-Heterocapsa_arctica.AAC.1